jgi:hypothetical protein
MKGQLTMFGVVQILIALFIVYATLPILQMGVNAITANKLSAMDNSIAMIIIPVLMMGLIVMIFKYIKFQRATGYGSYE